MPANLESFPQNIIRYRQLRCERDERRDLRARVLTSQPQQGQGQARYVRIVQEMNQTFRKHGSITRP